MSATKINIDANLSRFFTVKGPGFDENDVINMKDGGELQKAGTFRRWNIFRRAGRSKDECKANNDTRQRFLASLKAAFGLTETGKQLVDRLGKILGKDVFKPEDYSFGKDEETVDCGCPLTTRRIRFVHDTVRQLKDLADKYNNNAQQLSSKELAVLKEHGLIKEVEVMQAGVEGRVVEGSHEDKGIVSVGEEQTQFLQKEGFEVKPTSKNGNTLINSLLPQVGSGLGQKNEFNAVEESNAIKLLGKQLNGGANSPDYTMKCHFKLYRQNNDGQWEQMEKTPAKDFAPLGVEQYSDKQEVMEKQPAINRSYRQLALAASAYKRPVVLITMFDEDTGRNGTPLNSPRKYVFDRTVSGASLIAEPICVYRDQDGNYSRLAYTEEGRKTSEYQGLSQPEVYVEPKEHKTYYDAEGQVYESLTPQDSRRIEEGTLKLFDSMEKAWEAHKELLEEFKRKKENNEVEDDDLEEPSWNGPGMEEMEGVAKRKAEGKLKVAAMPKVEEIGKPVESEDKKEVKALYQKFQSEWPKFEQKLTGAFDEYVGNLPQPKGEMEAAERNLLKWEFDQLHEYLNFNNLHTVDELLPEDKDDLKDILGEIEKIEGNFVGRFKEMRNDIAEQRESPSYKALQEVVAGKLSEKFETVPKERLIKLIEQSGGYCKTAVKVLIGIDPSADFETAKETFQGDEWEDNVDSLVQQLDSKAEAEARLVAKEQEEAKKAEQEAELKRQAELEKRASELTKTMTADLKELCKERAVERFNEYYGKVVTEVFQTSALVEPMKLPPEVEEVIGAFTDKVIGQSQATIQKAAQAGEVRSDFAALKKDSECDSILMEACKKARDKVEADIRQKLLEGFFEMIKVRKAAQLKGYMEMASVETVRDLFNDWQTPDGQQGLMQFNAEVTARATRMAEDYEQKLCNYAQKYRSLDKAPPPLDSETVELRKNECAALQKGLGQMRVSVLKLAKKNDKSAANAILVQKVRPKLVSMMGSIMSGRETAKTALEKLISGLEQDGTGDALNKLVNGRWTNIRTAIDNAITPPKKNV